MSKFDPATVLKGSITDVTAAFGDYDDAQLTALHDHESGKDGAKRDGMLSAIHSEQSSRELTAKTKAAIDAAKKDHGVDLVAKADLDAAKDDHEQRIAALEADLKVAKGRQPARAVKPEKPRKLSITGEGEAKGATRVAFTDAEDTTIVGLPELEFGEGDFTPQAGGIVLDQPIRFPEGVSRTEVSKVWLVDNDGKAVAVSPLVNPLPVGGGTSASIPEGFLSFRRPEPTDTAKSKAA